MKKIVKYIFRGWENESINVHPKLKILPPILFDLLAFTIAIGILVNVIKWVFR